MIATSIYFPERLVNAALEGKLSFGNNNGGFDSEGNVLLLPPPPIKYKSYFLEEYGKLQKYNFKGEDVSEVKDPETDEATPEEEEDGGV